MKRERIAPFSFLSVGLGLRALCGFLCRLVCGGFRGFRGDFRFVLGNRFVEDERLARFALGAGFRANRVCRADGDLHGMTIGRDYGELTRADLIEVEYTREDVEDFRFRGVLGGGEGRYFLFHSIILPFLPL